jgi:DNA topoisomerase-1
VNYKIPKGTDPATLTHEKCVELMAAQPEAGNKKKGFGKKTAATKTTKTTKTTKSTKAKK